MRPSRVIIPRLLAVPVILWAGHAFGQTTITNPVHPTGGNTARMLNDRLGDQLSILDFGAACDGTTDDSAALIAAGNYMPPMGIPGTVPVRVPAGKTCYAGNLGWEYLPTRLTGPGQILTSDGYRRGLQYSAVTTAPNPSAVIPGGNVGTAFSLETGMTWDMSHALTAEEFIISGTATLGQPTSKYAYMPGASAHTAFFTNMSGWNDATDSNQGRTGAVFDQVIAQQAGQGDVIVHEAELSCMGVPKAGARTFLANPGCSFEAGNIGAGRAGQYLQKEEFHIHDDHGFVVAAIGRTTGYVRNEPMGTLNEFWEDSRIDCNSTSPSLPACDAVSTIAGKWRIGFDFSPVTTQVTAPLALRSQQFIYLNATNTDVNANPLLTSLGNDYIVDDGTGIILAQNGANVLRVANAPGAVNFWQMGGGGAGGVSLAPLGNSAAVPAIIGDKGGAGVVLESNGVIALKVAGPAGAVAYAEIDTPATAGQPVAFHPASTSATPLQLAGSGGASVVAGSPFDLSGQPLSVPAHVTDVGTTPTLACGTGATLDPGATDHAGIVNLGTGTFNNCIINFAQAYTNNPRCTFSPGGGVVYQLLQLAKFKTSLQIVQPNGVNFPTANAGYISYICE